MKKLFGTDGMRGEAGVFPLDARTVEIIGASLAAHLKLKIGRQATIVLGRDTRESGGWIEQALIKGAMNAGATCYSAGVISTPGVAYLTRTLPADAGVVISASHNEYQDNGIKIFSPSGQKIDEPTEALIETDIRSGKFPEPTSEPRSDGEVHRETDLQERYFEFLSDGVGSDLSLKDLTLVVDCANGAVSKLAPRLFKRLGAQTIGINCTPDGTNINRDCGSLHIDGLRKAVKERGADLGVAFDGDADRALFVDETANFADGDATLWVLANYLKAHGELSKSLVVATVMSNIGLELALRNIGVNLVRTDVGDKYVLDELLRSGGSLGGEQSGHIIFPKVSLAGDGMITALSLLRVIAEKRQPLSTLRNGMERYPQILVNVKVSEKVPFKEIPSLDEVVTSVESQLNGQGRLLLRYSGTESLARIMIEGRNEASIKNQAYSIARVIEKSIGVNSPRV